MKQPHKQIVAVFLLFTYGMGLAQAGHHPGKLPTLKGRDVANLVKDEEPVCPVAKSVDGRCVLPRAGQHFGAWRPPRALGNGNTMHGHRHVGVDLSGEGEIVPAVLEGVVVGLGRDESSAEGWFVRLRHNVKGVILHTWYMHMSKKGFAPGLRVGSIVKAGQMLGRVGSTGVNRSEAHLHFKLSDEHDKEIDPTPLLLVATPLGDTPRESEAPAQIAMETPPAATTVAARHGRTSRQRVLRYDLRGLDDRLAALMRQAALVNRPAPTPSVEPVAPAEEPAPAVVAEQPTTVAVAIANPAPEPTTQEVPYGPMPEPTPPTEVAMAPAPEPTVAASTQSAPSEVVSPPAAAPAPPPTPEQPTIVAEPAPVKVAMADTRPAARPKSKREQRTMRALQYNIKGLDVRLSLIVQEAMVLGTRRSQHSREEPVSMTFTVEETTGATGASVVMGSDSQAPMNFTLEEASLSPEAFRAREEEQRAAQRSAAQNKGNELLPLQ